MKASPTLMRIGVLLFALIGAGGKTYAQSGSAAYVLQQGPYNSVNLGSFVSSSTPNVGIHFIHPKSNEEHYIQTYYLTSKIATTPFQILDLNLTTGQSRVVDGALGVPSQVQPYSDGMLYFASYSPAYLTRYDAATGHATVVHQLIEGAQAFEIGDDRKLYFGQATKGYLERYDPAKDTEGVGASGSWENFGIVADPGPPYYRYIYSLYSDGKFAYMAIRDQNRAIPWFFVVKDLTTKAETRFLEDLNPIKIESFATRNGTGVACYTMVTDQPKSCYSFQGMKLVGSGASEPYVNPNWLNNLKTNYRVDASDKVADSSTNGSATFRWTKPADSTKYSATVPGIRLEPVPIRQIQPFSVHELIGYPVGYGPTFRVDPISRTAVMLGRTLTSLYDSKYSPNYRRWFFAGYSSVWQEYFPERAWSLNYTTERADTRVNPHEMPRPIEDQGHMMAKYYRLIDEDNLGFVYLAGSHERDSSGGSLIWYKPSTVDALPAGPIPATWGSPWVGADHGVLRAPFETSSISGLAATGGGSKIVISSRPCCNATGVGNLHVLDALSKQIEKTWSPLGLSDPGTIVTVSPTDVIAASGTTVYRFNTQTGAIVFSISAPSAIADRIRIGPDGYVWGFWGNALCRVNPTNGSLETIVATAPGSFAFLNRDIYVAQGVNIVRIADVFSSQSVPGAPTNLRLQ